MSFLCQVEKPILEEALTTVARAVNPRSPLPILSHVLLELHEQTSTLKLEATDLDLGHRISVPAQLGLDSAGAICVPAKLFADILGKLPAAPVDLSVSDNARLVIKCGRSRFEVAVLPAEEFPTWPLPGGKPEINIPQETWKTLVAHVKNAVAPTDESRAVMSGIMVEIAEDALVMVATDGRRLAFAKHTLPDALNQQTSEVVPGRAMTELARACCSKEDHLEVRLEENHLWALVGGQQTFCRLLAGRFPEYKRVIPDEFQRQARVGREALLAGLRRMLIVAQERESPGLVVFDFEGERLLLSANTPDLGLGTEEIPIVYEGADLRIAFNGKYFADALTVLACEEVVIDLQDDTRSAVVREHGETSFLHVVMPVRLKEATEEP